MRRFLHDNSLTLFFGGLFLLALGGQAVSGYFEFNNQQMTAGGATVSLLDYLTSSDFAVDTAENWQSEFLQFFLYITATIFLIQRGSTESKPPDRIGTESDYLQRIGVHARPESPTPARRGGFVLRFYSHSLGATMLLIFVLSWRAQAVAGRAAYNAQQLTQLEDSVSLLGYLGSADFWNRTLQNWQSEFLAIASMVVLSIYLRQRGSPESKPVGAAHSATGVES